MMNIDDLKYLELELPDPFEVEPRMVEGAATFSEEAWDRLDTALEMYEQSYEVLFDRLEENAVELDSYEASPSPHLMRGLRYSRRKFDAAFRDLAEDFRYFAEEFYAGRAENTVVDGPALSALASTIESGKTIISAIELMLKTHARFDIRAESLHATLATGAAARCDS